MNPPTRGHQRLVGKVKSIAKQERADTHIYISHTQNHKKILDYKTQVKLAKSAFGNNRQQSNDRTVIDILKSSKEL